MAFYRVLTGAHSEGKNEDGSPCIYGKGKKNGEIVETDNDLTKHNKAGITPKFEKLSQEEVERLKKRMSNKSKPASEEEEVSSSGGIPANIDSETIATMSFAELKVAAERMGVDPKQYKKKQELADALDELISDE